MANESILIDIQEDLSHTKKDPGLIYLRIELQDIQTAKNRHTYVVMDYGNWSNWESLCHEWLVKNPDPDCLYEVPVLTGLKRVKKRNDLIDGDSTPRVIDWQSTANKPTPAQQLFEFKEN